MEPLPKMFRGTVGGATAVFVRLNDAGESVYVAKPHCGSDRPLNDHQKAILVLADEIDRLTSLMSTRNGIPPAAPTDPIADLAMKAAIAQTEHLERFAAAYLKETSIPASEAELVQQVTPTEIVWFIRKRETPTEVPSGGMAGIKECGVCHGVGTVPDRGTTSGALLCNKCLGTGHVAAGAAEGVRVWEEDGFQWMLRQGHPLMVRTVSGLKGWRRSVYASFLEMLEELPDARELLGTELAAVVGEVGNG